MIKVTVVVPCLNMEKYIHSCLESILNQTLEELEVIVVDGGSVDGTLRILEDFAEVDKRVKIVHSDKKSYGYQVNIGVEQAIGQYIAIVDADDKIAKNMYEILYKEAVQSNADYVKGTAKAFYTISDRLIYSWPYMQFSREEYKDGKIICVPMDRPDLLTRDNFLWYGIFKSSFMRGICLHESSGAAFQDMGGLLQTQMQAKKAVYLDECFYEYRQDNALASQYNPKGFRFVWEEYTWAESFVINASDKWKAAFYRKWFLHAMDRYNAMVTAGVFWEEALIYIDLIRNKLKTMLMERVITESDFQENEKADLKIFLADGYGIFEKYKKTYIQNRDTLKSILEVAQNKEVIIFGYGNYGKFLYVQMIRQGRGTVVAFCDNQIEMHEKIIGDIPIMTPEEAVYLYPHSSFIIANSKHSDEMRSQLIRLGIKECMIYQYARGWDVRLLGESSFL